MPADPPCLPNCVMNRCRKRSVITGYSRRPSWGSTTLRRPYAAWRASLPGHLTCARRRPMDESIARQASWPVRMSGGPSYLGNDDQLRR